MSVQPIFNDGAAEAFAGRMLEHLTGASVALMTSIGHRSGLFDVMSKIPPSQSDEIAAVAGLDERYVREWLAALVTAGVIRYNPRSRRYTLPQEHAAVLTRAAGADNLASFARMIAGVAKVEDGILDAFRQGGGLPYAAFEDFHESMAELGDPVRERALSRLSELSPGLVQRLESGIDALDLGCGRGYVSVALAKRFPRSRFIGYDFSEDAIDYARGRAAEAGVENVRFEVRDAARITDAGQYGLVTSFDAIHDQAYPAAVLQNIHRALRRGGIYLMMEPDGSSHLENNLDHPLATILYTISCFHCMTVSLAQKGTGLGTLWGSELATQMLSDAGFDGIRVARLDGDIENAYFFARK